jgi:hypothetical protein
MSGDATARDLGRSLAVVAAVALAFAGALGHGFVNWDDGNYVVLNPMVHDPAAFGWRERLTTPALGYPVPLPVFLHGVLWAISSEPFGFHLLGVAVHLLDVGLLGLAMRRRGLRPGVTAAASLAFGLHPIVVEPVVWVTGLKDTLVGTGALLAMLAVAGGRVRPGLSILGVVVAAASKPSGAMVALALPVLAFVEGGRRIERRAWPLLAGLVAAGAAVLAFSIAQESPQLRTSADGGPSAGRVLGALGLHVLHVAVPAGLSPRYPPASIGALEIGSGLVAALAIVAAAIAWTRRGDPRGSWLWLGVCVYLPASNLQPLIRFTADSYVYVPWMAACAIGAFGFAAHAPRLAARARRLVAVGTGVVLAAWALLTHLQVGIWRDTVSLWESAARHYPDDGELVYRYGDALGRAGRNREEIALYLERLIALENAPQIPAALLSWYAFDGQPDACDHWYARAFASSVRQDDGVYLGYVEYVGRNPGRHRPEHDVALGHSLGVYAEQALAQTTLDGPALGRLAAHADRVGRPDVAAAFRAAILVP